MEFWEDFEQMNENDLSYYKETPVKIKGTLARIMFPKSPKIHESGDYAIVKINLTEVIEGELHPRALDRYGTISIKGNMPRLEYGDDYEFTITLDEVHNAYGASYQINFSRQDFQFDNEEDVKTFLSKILTESQVNELYKVFKNPLEIIESKDIESLIKVKGIGESTASKIIKKYEMTKDYASAYIELDSYDLSIDAITSLVDKYGSPDILIEKIKENPYLLTELDGYAFKKADKIALATGIGKNDLKRVVAFIEYALNDLGNMGYSWIDSGHLMTLIEENLGDDIDMGIVIEAVNLLKETRKIWNEEKGKIGAYKYYELELKIVKEFIRLLGGEIFISENWEKRISQAEKLQGYDYTEEQKMAIETIIKNPVTCVIGKAGCGKSTSVLGAIKALGSIQFAQCALSGKASARLKEITDMNAFTIHKLLGYNPKTGFEHNKDYQLDIDALILDEASMVGGDLFLKLLESIPTNSRFIMIGDIRQLSPIGALNVFYDIIDSGVIPVAELTQIHRQGRKSAIITESHKISEGEISIEEDFTGVEVLGELKDLTLDITNNRDSIPNKILEYFKSEFDKGYDILDLQIISPMNTKGESSVYALNKKIQKWYNPLKEEDAELTSKLKDNKFYNFRLGDKVMCIKNDYKLNDVEGNLVTIYNGYTGIITDILGNDMIVNFPLSDTEFDVVVPYEHWGVKKGIVLGYASTTAKNQGSGYKSIIYALDYSHYMLLSQEQLYTAVTRAEKNMILVAERKALFKALSLKESKDKQTFMVDLLREEIKI